MRLGIDARELQPTGLTGIGRYLRTFLRYLSTQGREHEVHLFGHYQPDDLRSDPRFQFHALRHLPSLLEDHVALPQRYAPYALDVFFSPYYKAPLTSSVPTVVVIHDLHFLGSGWRRSLGRRYVRRLAMAAARVVTVSEYSRHAIETELDLPPTAKLVTIPEAVSPQFVPLDAASCRETVCACLGLQKPYVLHVGNLKPHKNVRGLLGAYARLPEHLRKTYDVVILGRHDEHLASLKRLAVEAGVAGQVHWLSTAPEELMSQLYNAATLFVFPSLAEGFGLPPLEAMACGVPTITSNVTAVPEVVGDGAWQLDPADRSALAAAMQRLLEDEPARAAWRAKALSRAQRFTVDAFGCSLLGVIREAAAEGPAARGKGREASRVQRSTFDAVASHYDATIPAHVARHYLRKRLGFAQAWWPAGGRVLDVGCGTGRFIQRLAIRGYQVMGIDGSLGMLQQLRARCALPAVQGSVGALPFQNNSFDGLITIATIHHVIDPALLRAMIAEMVRITVPGGHVILWDHNPNNPYWKWLLPRLPQDAGGVRLVPLRELLRIARGLPSVRVRATFRSGAVSDGVPPAWLPAFQWLERRLERTWGLRHFLAHNVVVLQKSIGAEISQ